MKILQDKNNRILYKQIEPQKLLLKILIRTSNSLSKILAASCKDSIKAG
jgi:hypothetical protein